MSRKLDVLANNAHDRRTTSKLDRPPTRFGGAGERKRSATSVVNCNHRRTRSADAFAAAALPAGDWPMPAYCVDDGRFRARRRSSNASIRATCPPPPDLNAPARATTTTQRRVLYTVRAEQQPQLRVRLAPSVHHRQPSRRRRHAGVRPVTSRRVIDSARSLRRRRVVARVPAVRTASRYSQESAKRSSRRKTRRCRCSRVRSTVRSDYTRALFARIRTARRPRRYSRCALTPADKSKSCIRVATDATARTPNPSGEFAEPALSAVYCVSISNLI